MAGYIRQSSFVDGDTITAALFNDEYNQLVNAFSNTNGHKHDGTTAEGPVIGLIGDAGETSPNNKVLIDTTNNYIEFYIEVASAPVQQLYIADGAIVPVTDNDIDLGTSSLEFKNLYLDGTATIDTLTVDEAATIGTTLGVTGATTLSSTLAVTGATTLSSTLAVTGATTLSSTLAVTGTSTLTGNVTTTNDLSVGGNLTVTGNATISGNLTFGDADTDTITIGADVASNITPDVDDTYDLGTSTKEWRNLYIDGTANIDSLVADTADINAGTIDNTVIGGTTAVAGSFTTATATTGNITTVNATTVDTTNIEVTNLKAKDGTSAGSIADTTGVVTLASSVLTTTDINGGTIDGVTIGGTSAGAVTFTDLSDGTITITAFVDEDNMASDSATLVPTQQSVKAYVDSQVTAQDLDFQGDTGGALSIDLDSETLTIAGGTGIDTVGATNTLTVSIDSTVATLTGTQTLTNKTLTTPVISSISNTGTLTLPTSTDTLVGRATTDTLINKTLTSPVINTGVSGTAVLDDDTFATATATTLATSESIKAYVDTTVAATNEVVEDTTPQLGGDLDLNSNDITGTGNINNTGTITTDGLTVDGVAKVLGAASNTIVIADATETNGYQLKANASASSDFGFIIEDLAGKDLLKIESNNDISFYEDTGTTAKLFWDASAESLGIGTTSPDATLQIGSNVQTPGTGGDDFLIATNSNTGMTIESGNTSVGSITFNDTDGINRGRFWYDHTGDYLRVDVNGSERLRIDSSGNVGIGTDSPSTILGGNSLEVSNATGSEVIVFRNDGSAVADDFCGGFVIGNKDASGTPNHYAGMWADTDTLGQMTLQFAGGRDKYEAGTADMVIDVNGQVGIGTASPAFTLDAYHATDNGIARFTSGDASAYIAISDVNTTGAGNQIGITTDDMWFKTSNTERVRIDSSGNVGIGTDSPDAILHIEGGGVDSLRFGNIGVSSNSALRISRDDTTISNNNPLGYLEFGGKANTGNVDTAHAYIAAIASGTHAAGDNPTDLTFGTTPDGSSTMTEVMRINSSGKVGIGTTSPSQSLDVIGRVYTSSEEDINMDASANGHLRIDGVGYAAALALNTTGLNIYTNSASRGIVFGVNETEKMRIDSSGNVGIGTTSPQVRLSIDNSATGGEALRIGDTSGASGATIGETYLGFTAYSSGTTQTYPHAWIGVTEYDASDQRGILTFGTRQSNADVAPTEAMRIDSSGNVGIGTTTPSATLVVQDNSFINIDASDATYPFIGSVGSSSDDLVVGSWGDVQICADINGTSGQNIIFKEGGSGASGTELMRIATDGRLQLANLTATNTDLSIFAKGNYLYALGGTAGAILADDANQSNRILLSNSGNYVKFDTNGGERVRINGSGHFLVGVTSYSGSTEGVKIEVNGLYIGKATTAIQHCARFENPNGEVGSIKTTGTSTQFNTSSDARLKDVTGSARGLEVINALNPVAFNWTTDGKSDEGLLAQEVQEIVPNAVSGSEEEYYQMDYSKLVTHLVAGMKEQQVLIEQLQAEVALLKGE